MEKGARVLIVVLLQTFLAVYDFKALINEGTLLSTQMFPRLPARATFVADTKNVSDFVQKHFVSATNVSSLRSPRNIMGNNVSLFTRAFKSLIAHLRVFVSRVDKTS